MDGLEDGLRGGEMGVEFFDLLSGGDAETEVACCGIFHVRGCRELTTKRDNLGVGFLKCFLKAGGTATLILISAVNRKELHFECGLLVEEKRDRIIMNEIHKIVTVVPEA